jgi:hypothetical protein
MKGDMMDNEKLVKEFNENFSRYPFLPDGFAKAKLKKDGSVMFKIGPRDLHLGPNGEFWGSGSVVVPMWNISKVNGKDK